MVKLNSNILHELREVCKDVALMYPEPFRRHQIDDIERISFHAALLFRNGWRAQSVCDLGGGIGMFSPVCAKIGMRSILIDDFEDVDISPRAEEVLEIVHRRLGVCVIRSSLACNPVQDIDGGIDAFTCFETLEHLPFSPRPFLKSAVEKMSAGGILVMSAPNCVDLKRRIDVLRGIDRWSSLEEWYFRVKFRGHVREMNPDDLKIIMEDLGLKRIEIFGKNWWGESLQIRLASSFIESMTSLCSTIYAVGFKI